MRRLLHLLSERKEARYVLSGLASEAIEYGSFLALYATSHWLLFSNSIGFVLGIASGFVLHKLWSFAGAQQLRTHHQVVAYSLVGGANFVLSNILIAFLVDGLHLGAALAKLLVMAAMAVWTYVIMNVIIFRHTSGES